MSAEVTKMFEELKTKGLSQEEFPEELSWDDYVSELHSAAPDDQKLKKLLSIKRVATNVEQTTLEKIMTSNFEIAKDTIDQMTLVKRISMLDELNAYRDYLYESISKYGKKGLSKDEQLTASEFRILMGRIKHLEILQNWLYGVD